MINLKLFCKIWSFIILPENKEFLFYGKRVTWNDPERYHIKYIGNQFEDSYTKHICILKDMQNPIDKNTQWLLSSLSIPLKFKQEVEFVGI